MIDLSVKNKIIELRKEGKSYKDISKLLNCSRGYISTICVKENLNDIGLNKIRKLESIEIDSLKEYYKSHTKEETCEKFGVSTFYIYKYCDIKREKFTEDELKKKNYLKVKLSRKNIKEKSVIYKGGKCQICVYDKCIRALDFHHLDPNKKEFEISRNCSKTWNKIQLELDKCILVCANCHREIHDGMHNTIYF